VNIVDSSRVAWSREKSGVKYSRVEYSRVWSRVW